MNSTLRPLILCVDDNWDMLKLMERLLKTGGYRVALASSGARGLELASSAKPNLILLDVVMPEMDGYVVCEKLKQYNGTAHIPVIFLTALGENEYKIKALAAGGVDYLAKPFGKETLLGKIRAYL